MPEQKITRDALFTVASPITGKNVPDVKSLIDDAAARRRSIDFGVKTTIGRRFGFAAWKRNKWK